MKRRSLWYWIFIRIPLWWITLSVLLVLLLRWVPVYYTPLMLVRSIESRGEGDFSLSHKWVGIDRISPNLVKCVVASEDNRFFTHNGFDWEEIDKMLREHEQKGKKIRGCSTISQQTAKNVFTFCSSTMARKVLEAYWTFLIEKIWGKKRIMEVYLNVAEMGNGIFGCEACSRHYFSHSAKDLTLSESAGIAYTLPSPRKRTPRDSGQYALTRRRQIESLCSKIAYPDWVRK